MTKARRISLFVMLLSGGISLLWGFAAGRSVPGGIMGFPGIYYGTRCLIQHCDPYNVSELQSLYRTEGGERPVETILRRQSVTLYVNMPTTFLIIAPFAMLPLGPARVLWTILIVGSFLLAAFLMWSLGKRYAAHLSLFLVCILLANSEIIFAGGNTAGIVVSLCVIAVWCFLQERFVAAGILCLAISLAIKPHDAGLVWLYFLLAGGVSRKRALQTMAATIVLSLAAILWVSHVAPHWMPEMCSNLAVISAHGGINDPTPTSIGMSNSDMIIDLQTVISVFRDDPHFYNLFSYLVCGALLLVWALKTLKSRSSPTRAWLALAVVVPLTMLVTYHRTYDAKLLLLTVPACAMLWAEGSPIGRFALLVNTAAIVLTGDIPVIILVTLTRGLHASPTGLYGKILTVVLTRPVPLILLVMVIFYLWVYVRSAPDRAATTASAGSEARPIAPTMT